VAKNKPDISCLPSTQAGRQGRQRGSGKTAFIPASSAAAGKRPTSSDIWVED